MSLTEGRWNSALDLAPDGILSYSREGNFDLAEGTVEMWLALRADGDDPLYQEGWHAFFASHDGEDSISMVRANERVADARLQFLVGDATGTVWIDDVYMGEAVPIVLRRQFDNGLVLLNASSETQTIEVGPGYRRLVGQQAPRYEYIVDDADPGFSATWEWTLATLDGGEWRAAGPFFDDWGWGCRVADCARIRRLEWRSRV